MTSWMQGAPYGFQAGCLPLLLRRDGLSFSALGGLKLLFLPWVCKPLYAPLVETTRTRAWWLRARYSFYLLLVNSNLLASNFVLP